MHEANHAESMPDRLKYHAAARYRLRSNRARLSANQSTSKFAAGAEALESHVSPRASEVDLKQSCESRTSTKCHDCLDMFREHPQLVRQWRILWLRSDKLVYLGNGP